MSLKKLQKKSLLIQNNKQNRKSRKKRNREDRFKNNKKNHNPQLHTKNIDLSKNQKLTKMFKKM